MCKKLKYINKHTYIYIYIYVVKQKLINKHKKTIICKRHGAFNQHARAAPSAVSGNVFPGARENHRLLLRKPAKV